VVFGGMLASTLLAIPFVPVFYIMMQRIREKLGAHTLRDRKTSGNPNPAGPQLK